MRVKKHKKERTLSPTTSTVLRNVLILVPCKIVRTVDVVPRKVQGKVLGFDVAVVRMLVDVKVREREGLRTYEEEVQ